MFWKQRAKLEARIEREKDRWRSPRTESGSKIELAEVLLFALVFLVVMAMLAVAPKVPFVHLLIFAVGVMALSTQGRAMAVPFIYNLMAAKFQWPDFDTARAAEASARQAERASKSGGDAASAPAPVAVAAAPASPDPSTAPTVAEPALDNHARSVLAAFLAMDKASRKARVLQVVSYCQGKGIALAGLADAEDEDEKVVLGEIALKKLAKLHGIEVAHEHAG